MDIDLKEGTCILFVRGTDDTSHNNVEQQHLNLLDFARRKHMTVVGDVRLINVSANGPESVAALNALLKRKSEKDDFSLLVAADLTRMARGSICRTMDVIQKFARAGVKVITLDNGVIDASLFNTFKVHRRKKGWIRRNENPRKSCHSAHTEAHDGRGE